MALTKIKIRNLITEFNVKNTEDIGYPFFGINIDKEFMPSVASTDSVDRSKYKIVKKGVFVFSGMQTGRDCCIRIAMYEKDDIVLVSPAYTTFTVTSPLILPEYLFMYFRSSEKDRYGAFLSDGSIRSNLDWDVFCNIEIELPSIDIQRKYVEIYTGMIDNQVAYETGLEDLKLVCDGYIEELRRNISCEKIGSYIEEVTTKNENETYSIEAIRGISIGKEFIDTKADLDGVSAKGYKIVQSGYFAFNPNTARMGDKICIALNSSPDVYLVSSIYPVFKICDENKLLSEYLMMWLKREEFDRYARFNSWGSARETFNFSDMADVKIPIPSLETQKAIVDIYNAYILRKEINEQLKQQIKNICPILIQGAMKEAKRS